MAVIYQIGPKFFAGRIHNLKPSTPLLHMGTTVEQHAPYRTGRGAIFHYGLGRGLIFGWWTGKHDTEESALMAGMQAREDELVDENGKLLERFQVQQAARRVVAANSADPDDEWAILTMVGLTDEQPDSFACTDDEEDHAEDHLNMVESDPDEDER